MNEIFINALVERIKADKDREDIMTINDVPIPYQEEVQARLDSLM